VHTKPIQPSIWVRVFPFLLWLQQTNSQSLRADVMAGITGAIIVLPQGVAYAMIAGMPPEYGLYAAIIPAIIAALFGSSFHLISGPTAALSIVVFTTLSPMATPGSPEFVQLALTLTLLAGLFQLILGLVRMGTLVNFISHSVVIGFTSGAAILIATSQLKNVFGIDIPSGESFAHTWVELFYEIDQTNYYNLLVALVTILSALAIKKWLKKIPNMLLAMIIGSVLAFFLGAEQHHIALVGSIPAQLPPISNPSWSFAVIRDLMPGALAIGLLGLVEAVSIARSVAIHSNQRIDGNQEFIGQGLSNIAGAFFSGYASSGSFTRTGVNYSAGAKSPLAAIFAAIALAFIILLLAPLTAYVPIASMAGILLIVSYNLIDLHHIKSIAFASRSEFTVLMVTFTATLFLHLEFAIYVGVMLSLVIYLNRTSKPNIVTLAPDPKSIRHRLTNVARKPLTECPQLKIIRIDGSLFFGAVDYVQKHLQEIPESHILIVGSGINFIDVAGAEMLAHEAKRRRTLGGGLYFSNMKIRARTIFERGGYLADIDPNMIFEVKTDAIKTAFAHLDVSRCQTCSARIFEECQQFVPASISPST
jgi:sulfate permease, SulP family